MLVTEGWGLGGAEGDTECGVCLLTDKKGIYLKVAQMPTERLLSLPVDGAKAGTVKRERGSS